MAKRNKISRLKILLPTIISFVGLGAIFFLGFFSVIAPINKSQEAGIAVAIMFILLAAFITSYGAHRTFNKEKSVTNEKMQGSAMLSENIREYWISTIQPLYEFFGNFAIHPNFLTIVGLVLSVLAGLFFSKGWFFLAGWTMLIAGTFDILDGQYARATGQVTRYGAYFDSVMDRYAEIFIFVGLAVYYRSSYVLIVVLMALMGSIMVSYTRARAEGLGVQCKVGVLQRPERIVIIAFGAIFTSIFHMMHEAFHFDLGEIPFVIVLCFIAAIANYTAMERLRHVIRILRERNSF